MPLSAGDGGAKGGRRTSLVSLNRSAAMAKGSVSEDERPGMAMRTGTRRASRETATLAHVASDSSAFSWRPKSEQQ